MYQLPTFKGYTIDERLKEFRKVTRGKEPTIEFIPFDSDKGKKILEGYLKKGGEVSMREPTKLLFQLGRLVMTPGAREALEEAGQTPSELLKRHAFGDWGEVCKEDKEENELSLREGFRLLSAYKLHTGVKVWVITEADRSATTLLLPEEY